MEWGGQRGTSAYTETILAQVLAPAVQEQRMRPLNPILHPMRRTSHHCTFLPALVEGRCLYFMMPHILSVSKGFLHVIWGMQVEKVAI